MTDLGMSLDGSFLPRLSPNASKDEQTSVINGIVDRLNDLLKTQVFSDATTKRYLSGYQKGGWPGGDFGMKISLTGVDVTKATASQLLFSWDFTAGTQYWYDPSTHKNYMQTGILPNGVGGNAIAKTGHDVSEAY